MNHKLYINKQNVVDNIELCRGEKEVCLMVKADTYGIGDIGCKMLIDLGYKFFGVSTIEEALKLRTFSSEIKILIVSYIKLEDIATCIDNQITFTVYDFKMIDLLDNNANFHLKIDTNMGRLGFQLDELERVATILERKQLSPEGIFSHLACAADRSKTEIAISNFEYALDVFKQFEFKYIHLLNSFGSLNYDTKFDNLVRIGIAIWGYGADRNEAEQSRHVLKPALRLDLTVSHTKDYDSYISYDHLEHVTGYILTVPLGYHDGFSRKFRGYQIPNVGTVVGNVNMCQHMIKAQNKDLNRGDLFTLFTGNSIYDLCEYAQITTYELLVSLSARIDREII